MLELVFEAQTVHRQHWPAGDIELATLLSVKTGGCPENCGYCPQAAEFDTGVKAEKLMEVEEVVRAAQAAKDAGATRFCMGAAWRAPKTATLKSQRPHWRRESAWACRPAPRWACSNRTRRRR